MDQQERDQKNFHRVDLETAAALGCAKCLREHDTGEKSRRGHDENCPRKRPVVGGCPSTVPSAASFSASTASVAVVATAGSKRKRPPEEAVEGGEEGDEWAGGEKPAAAETAPLPRPGPARVGNCVDFPVSNLRAHLVCSLCGGYFRDPHTVADCLHTFCRSCLILFFRQGARCCPTCNTRLGPDPFHTSISIQSREVIPDRTLQEVVHKIFPWMKAKEKEEERDFYARRGIALKPEYAQEGTQASAGGGDGPGRGGGGGRTSAPSGTADDLLDLRLVPDARPPRLRQRLPPLRGPFLRTSGRLKVSGLKKYLARRLGTNGSRSMIEVLCNGDPMGDELSLTFILRTRWFSDDVLTLRYRLEEEDAKSL